jgi:hypothetical protein
MPEGHPYMSARDVYDRLRRADLHEPEPERSPSPAMLTGTILEPAILRAAAARWGWRVHANSHTNLHRTAPLCATPDAYRYRDPNANAWGVDERALVEVKYSANPAGWATVPWHVYYQVQAQLACSEYQYGVVVVLAGGLRHWTIERDKPAIRRMCAQAHRMLARVRAGDPPAHALPKPEGLLIEGPRPTRPPSLSGVPIDAW